MLSPKYIDHLPDAMVALYSQVEQDILADMAERISAVDDFIPATQWQYRKLIEMGNYHSYVVNALSSLTGKTSEEIQHIMERSGQRALKFDSAIYSNAGLDPPTLAASEPLQAILRSGMAQTNGLFDNLTRTTANTSTKQFEHALDRAWLQVNSGAFSRQEATRMAVKDLARCGVEAVTYPSGHIDHLDVAVRRAVLTGVNQTALKLQDALADSVGCDLVETTAHAGARPDHALWQGKVFSRSDASKKYPNFRESTGYGTGPGLGGWNCRHSFFPFFEGLSEPAYTEEERAALNATKYVYQGQKLTEYEATQRQREIERNIRRWKRESTAMKAAGLDTGEASAKLKRWQDKETDFLSQTGLKRQQERAQIAGWGRSQAATAAQEGRRLHSAQQRAILTAEIKKASGIRGELCIRPDRPDTAGMTFDGKHTNKERKHGVSETKAKEFIAHARVSVTRWGGKFVNYYAKDGAAYVNTETHEIRTAFRADEYDTVVKKLLEEVERRG